MYESTRQNISKDIDLDQEVCDKVTSCLPQYWTNFPLADFRYICLFVLTK